MTVCVAAIAENDRVVGVSDRMLSNNEIAFEPQSRKVWTLTSAIHAMVSGDATVHAEVLAGVQADIAAYLRSSAEWLAVQWIVDCYRAHWNALRVRRAEQVFLAPLNLTMATFLERQRVMDPGVADRLTNAIIQYQLPYAGCIIAGIDHTGPHVWVIEDGVARCEDVVGFAAIGAGQRHAQSQMMIGQYAPHRSTTDTVVLLHLAKKRAEVAPSVGAATDMFLIGPALGQQAFVADEHIARLDADYKRLVRMEQRALGKAHTEFGAYLVALSQRQVSSQEATEAG